MSLQIALQMDPLDAVNVDADSTFQLGLEAQNRGYGVFQYTADALRYDEGRVMAMGRWVMLTRAQGDHVSYGEWVDLDLSTLDVIWLRQDPPFDMSYITNTHMLDRLKKDVLVVNDPFWVRNCPEKLMVLDWPELTPATMIARDLDALRAFRARHGDIVVKPLYGNGGAGVFVLRKGDQNLTSLHEMFTNNSREPIIAQAFLSRVSEGDKRIILIDGAPVGAINRVPPEGEARSNMHVGGRAEKIGLTAREMQICAAIGPTLKERGLLFTGIDVIDGWLTEINVTSPTGIQEMDRFNSTDTAALIWDAVEARLPVSP